MSENMFVFFAVLVCCCFLLGGGTVPNATPEKGRGVWRLERGLEEWYVVTG